jgi:predicted permease
MGANTAIFSLINTLMLRTLPVSKPEQLVELLHTYPGDPPVNGYSQEMFRYMRDHNESLSGLVAASDARLSARVDGEETQFVDSEFVDGSFFPVLGVMPALGRTLTPGDDRENADTAPAAVVSWAFWKSLFHMDPATVGKRIVIENVPVTIIGVAARQFAGIEVEYAPQVWLPLSIQARIQGAHRAGVGLIGRLKPGVSLGSASAEMGALFMQTFPEAMLRNDPKLRRTTFELASAAAGISHLRGQFRRPLLALMIVVALLLLIACVNVAGMLLARAAGRRQEMAVRVSLGAGRLQLLRQTLTESMLLSAAGAVLGVLLAYFIASALARTIESGRYFSPIRLHTELDVRVTLFTALAALATGLLFGITPAVRAMRTTPASAMQGARGAGETKLGRRFGQSLVVTQVALSLALLSAAGSFLRYLSNLRGAGLGFERNGILLVTLDPAGGGYSGERLGRSYQELLTRFAAIPGVRSATLSGTTPINGAAASRFVDVEGFQEASARRERVMLNSVAPKYFKTFGTPLLAGRDFTWNEGAAHPAIVNRAMARYYFGEANPIGRRFTLEREQSPREIVGVVGDAKYDELHDAPPRTIYLPAFRPGGVEGNRFALRTKVEPESVTADVRRAVRATMSTVPISNLTTLADQMDATIVPERLLAILSGWFAATGALLATIGLYGLLSYSVTRRTREIGVRMALGAARGKVIGMVLSDALWMLAAGLTVGAVLAFWGLRFAARLVPNLPVSNPVPILFGVAMLAAIGLIAAYVPARRAARVEPMSALRYE